MRRWLLDVTQRPVTVQEVSDVAPGMPDGRCGERATRTVTHLTRRREAPQMLRVGSSRDPGSPRLAR